MKKCVLIAAAPEAGYISEDYKLKMKSLLLGDEFIIVVDGGLSLAAVLSLEPNILIGDLDSIDKKSEAFLKLSKEKILRLPVEKDDTDSMFAARFITEQGFDEVVFLGGIGGRLDHTLGNLAVSSFLTFAGIETTMIDEFSVVKFLKSGKHIFKKDEFNFDTFSLIPYGGEVCGVSLRGAHYPLKDAVLRTDFPIGVSNKIDEDFLEIEFSKGTVIIIFSNS